MLNTPPRNISVYISKLKKIGLITLIIYCSVCLFKDKTNFALSGCLGMGFSYLILHNLIDTQAAILSQKSKSLVFPRYFFRLFLYGVPVSLTLYFPKYLSFGILLPFLFYFQVLYLIMEISKMAGNIKKKKRN